MPVSMHLALCLFPGSQAHDARHHRRYGPEGHVIPGYGPDSVNCLEVPLFRSCSSSKVVIIPVVALWLPMVQTVRRTIVTLQLYVNKVIDAPVMQFVRVPQVVYIPVATWRLIPMVSLTMEIAHLLLDNVVDVLLGRWCEFQRCRRGEDRCAPTVAPVEKLVAGSS